MPEGPELRVSADILKKQLIGNHIVSICALGGRYADSAPAGLGEFHEEMTPTCTIIDVNAKGKFMYWKLSNNWFVWTTYGMSGQWILDSMGGSPKHTALGMYLSSPLDYELSRISASVNFRDPRHFGTVKFSRGQEALDAKLATLGPDMLSDPPSPELFRARIRLRSTKTLAEAVMDQYVISGVGNYIKAEAFHAACLSPHRLCSALSDNDLDRLRLTIIDVMQRSYVATGATIHTYENADGTKGAFADQLQVYGRKTDRSGNTVIKEETLDGRKTSWCPAVQF